MRMQDAEHVNAADYPQADGVIHLRDGFRIERQRPGAWFAYHGDRWAGTVSLASSGGEPFASASLEPWARGRGVATAMYDAIERDISRSLVPSPLGLMPDAISFWHRRLAEVTPEARTEAFHTARALGHGFGLTDKTVVYGRLDQVFDLAEVSPNLVRDGDLVSRSGPRH